MNNSNTYYQRNKKRLLEQAWNRYHQESSKQKVKGYYENNLKKSCESKPEIDTENYPIKKKI